MAVGEHVEVSLTDTGKGMEAQLIPHVFEFTQGERTPDRAQGGLLVKSLVELHGGHVTAESEGPGKGSTLPP